MNHILLHITLICFFGIYSLQGMDTPPNIPNTQPTITNLLNPTNVNTDTQPIVFLNNSLSAFAYNKMNIPPSSLTVIKAPKAKLKKQHSIVNPSLKKKRTSRTPAHIKALCGTIMLKQPLMCDMCNKEFKNPNPAYFNSHKKACSNNRGNSSK